MNDYERDIRRAKRAVIGFTALSVVLLLVTFASEEKSALYVFGGFTATLKLTVLSLVLYLEPTINRWITEHISTHRKSKYGLASLAIGITTFAITLFVFYERPGQNFALTIATATAFFISYVALRLSSGLLSEIYATARQRRRSHERAMTARRNVWQKRRRPAFGKN